MLFFTYLNPMKRVVFIEKKYFNLVIFFLESKCGRGTNDSLHCGRELDEKWHDGFFSSRIWSCIACRHGQYSHRRAKINHGSCFWGRNNNKKKREKDFTLRNFGMSSGMASRHTMAIMRATAHWRFSWILLSSWNYVPN